MKRIFIVAIVFIACFFFLAQGACPQDDPEGKSEYKLQSTDVIIISVHSQPDLTTKTRLTTDGYITFPLLGKVSAQGLTVQELEQKMKVLLEKDYLVTAEVVVFIEEYHPRQVSVIGEVKNPGKYDMPGEKDMTLMEAIAMAGGFTKHADLTKTKVMRMEDGAKKTITINAEDITKRDEKDKDIVLKAEDMVVVPESFF
jgi:polysaccharide export outer membrane protein